MHDINRWLRVRNRDQETKDALRAYAATIGCIRIAGRYWTVYEHDPASDTISIGKVSPEGKMIEKPGCRYVTAWDEEGARDKFKNIKS